MIKNSDLYTIRLFASHVEWQRVVKGLPEEVAVARFVGLLNTLGLDVETHWGYVDQKISVDHENESYFWMIRRLRNYPEYWIRDKLIDRELSNKSQTAIESKSIAIANQLMCFGFHDMTLKSEEEGYLNFVGFEDDSNEKIMLRVNLLDYTVCTKPLSWEGEEVLIGGVFIPQ